MDEPENMLIRPVHREDHAEVLALVRTFVDQQKVLPRTLDELSTLWPHEIRLIGLRKVRDDMPLPRVRPSQLSLRRRACPTSLL